MQSVTPLIVDRPRIDEMFGKIGEVLGAVGQGRTFTAFRRCDRG